MQFRQGHFLGDYQMRREWQDSSLAEMTPTVPEHEIETHTHDDAHFLFLMEGRYVSSARGMPSVCDEAAMIMNPPGTHHRDCFRGMQGRFMTLSLSANHWRHITQDYAVADYALRLDSGGLQSAYRLWRELHRWDDASALVVESECQNLLFEASRARREEQCPAPAWLARAREYLRDNCFETPNLSELARAADLHPVYFTRAFRERYGCSPGQYLRRCRLEKAAGMLRDKRLSLSDIASSCGFVDQSHFHHGFKQTFGTSPQQFRQLGRAEQRFKPYKTA